MRLPIAVLIAIATACSSSSDLQPGSGFEAQRGGRPVFHNQSRKIGIADAAEQSFLVLLHARKKYGVMEYDPAIRELAVLMCGTAPETRQKIFESEIDDIFPAQHVEGAESAGCGVLGNRDFSVSYYGTVFPER